MRSTKRPRKRRQQLELQRFDKNGQRRVGPHPRAGRPPKGERAGSPHKPRAEVNARHPQHVTLRVVREVGWLRKPNTYRAIRRALGVALDRHHDFRIVHFSLQGDHVHLLCEASNKLTLARGVQGFQISAAKHLNREVSRKRHDKRRGQVFADRYHVEAIDSVRQARHALSYVLNNWRKHRQDRETAGLYEGRIDPYSSGVLFAGWKERTRLVSIPPDYEPPRVSMPQTWYLTEGYKRAAPISVFEVPGAS
jgi:REP element-mobilizing transposase RayT